MCWSLVIGGRGCTASLITKDCRLIVISFMTVFVQVSVNVSLQRTSRQLQGGVAIKCYPCAAMYIHESVKCLYHLVKGNRSIVEWALNSTACLTRPTCSLKDML